jgi:hypothetical protein
MHPLGYGVCIYKLEIKEQFFGKIFSQGRIVKIIGFFMNKMMG